LGSTVKVSLAIASGNSGLASSSGRITSACSTGSSIVIGSRCGKGVDWALAISNQSATSTSGTGTITSQALLVATVGVLKAGAGSDRSGFSGSGASKCAGNACSVVIKSVGVGFTLAISNGSAAGISGTGSITSSACTVGGGRICIGGALASIDGSAAGISGTVVNASSACTVGGGRICIGGALAISVGSAAGISGTVVNASSAFSVASSSVGAGFTHASTVNVGSGRMTILASAICRVGTGRNFSGRACARCCSSVRGPTIVGWANKCSSDYGGAGGSIARARTSSAPGSIRVSQIVSIFAGWACARRDGIGSSSSERTSGASGTCTCDI